MREMTNYREPAYALLRITFGTIFLSTGTMKVLNGLGNFVGTMNQRFAGKLPAVMVMPFAYFIPFAEVAAGALILFGLFTRGALVLSGLLLLGLTFGVVILGEPPTVAHNLQYGLINFVLLWFSDLNGFSLDRLLDRTPRRVNTGN
jgi:thiosulfate dehydrogenase [quinone] large subunit